MLRDAIRNKDLAGYFKIFIAPFLIIVVIGFLFSQCSITKNIKNNSGNSGLFWWQTNTCGEGSWFDTFSDGSGRWRNLDGKFCSK